MVVSVKPTYAQHFTDKRLELLVNSFIPRPICWKQVNNLGKLCTKMEKRGSGKAEQRRVVGRGRTRS